MGQYHLSAMELHEDGLLILKLIIVPIPQTHFNFTRQCLSPLVSGVFAIAACLYIDNYLHVGSTLISVTRTMFPVSAQY